MATSSLASSKASEVEARGGGACPSCKARIRILLLSRFF